MTNSSTLHISHIEPFSRRRWMPNLLAGSPNKRIVLPGVCSSIACKTFDQKRASSSLSLWEKWFFFEAEIDLLDGKGPQQVLINKASAKKWLVVHDENDKIQDVAKAFFACPDIKNAQKRLFFYTQAAPAMRNAETFETLSKIQESSNLSEEELQEILDFTKQNHAAYTERCWKSGMDYLQIRPRESGLVRSLLFFADGTVILKLNRSAFDHQIGSGSFSTVKPAFDLVHQKMLALATSLHPNRYSCSKSRDKKGYDSYCRIKPDERDHIVGIHGSIEGIKKSGSKRTFVLIMDKARCDLSHALDERISKATKKIWAQEFLEGLSAIHDAGIIHKDIKPENILIDTKDALRIADFGLSIPKKESHLKGGSPYYMSPEQLNGKEKADQRDDIWSAGFVLLSLLGEEISSFIRQDLEEIDDETELNERGWILIDDEDFDAQRALNPEGAKLALLVADMLQYSRHKRPTAKQVLRRLQKIL